MMGDAAGEPAGLRVSTDAESNIDGHGDASRATIESA